MKLFIPIMTFLPCAMDSIVDDDLSSVYSEDVVSCVLGLLTQALDGSKPNQEYILNNFKIKDVLWLVVNQNEYLEVAGRGCLVLSHILHGNQRAQKLFESPEVVERLIFLSDFNQLINESNPDSSIESLQEISFFAFMAIMNHTSSNKQV